MTIELLDTENEETENVADSEKYSNYVERYADNSNTQMPNRKSRDSNSADHSDQEQDGVRICFFELRNFFCFFYLDFWVFHIHFLSNRSYSFEYQY